MKEFKLEISYPLIIKAPEQAQIWLENIFGMTLIEKFIERFKLNYKIIKTNEKGPMLVIEGIKEKDLDENIKKLQELILHTIDNAIARSAINKYISNKDLVITLKSNFDDINNRLPELKGMF